MKIYKFNSLAYANSFADRCTKSMVVMLGDDGRFWVATFATATKLARQGYQLA